jgi:hypothetical protein
MLTLTAYGLAILINVLIIVVGVRFVALPRAAAAGYGVPAKVDGDVAYLTMNANTAHNTMP